MIRAFAVSLALLAIPAFAEEDHHDHDHHVSSANGIRAIHAWANATEGSSALVYVELANTSDEAVVLTGAHTDIAATAQLVGLANSGGELRFEAIEQMPIAPGAQIVLSPNALAIQLSGLNAPLIEGDTFEIEFAFGAVHLDAVVAVEAAGATQHSHAGHSH